MAGYQDGELLMGIGMSVRPSVRPSLSGCRQQRTIQPIAHLQGDTMAIVLHIVNTPKSDAREAYEASWVEMEQQGITHPPGRRSHTAWLVGDVFHVLDVWESQEDFDAFMTQLGPILGASGMELAGPPEVGELINVVVETAALPDLRGSVG
jgi:hypothetical protein